MNFFFPAPAISVQITASPDTPVLGQSYSLTCGVTGADNLNPSITYQWTNNNGAQIGTDRVFSFSSFRLSDAGQYTCQAAVSSLYLNNDITITNTHDVRIQSKFGYILVHVCRWVTVDKHAGVCHSYYACTPVPAYLQDRNM
jgi:hypothetical protein